MMYEAAGVRRSQKEPRLKPKLKHQTEAEELQGNSGKKETFV